MRIIIQRVNQASVQVDKKDIGSIGRGLLLLVGFSNRDDETCLQNSIDKILKLRLFPKAEGLSEFDVSVSEINGGILVVSQFTLYADCSRGRRPSFSDAMSPEPAKVLYDKFCALLRLTYRDGTIAEGAFGADMKVMLENDGPVTICL